MGGGGVAAGVGGAGACERNAEAQRAQRGTEELHGHGGLTAG